MRPALLVVSLLAAFGPPVDMLAGDQSVNAGSAVIQDFEKRVSAYLQLRRNAESSLHALKATDSPEKIADHQNELAHAVRNARKSAREGDIFTSPAGVEIRRLLRFAMRPADAPHVRQSLQHAEPVRLHLHVGDTYPAHVPLQSTPPTILENLPKLPPEIEYRITGRDLVLLDTKANLVLDIIENVFP